MDRRSIIKTEDGSTSVFDPKTGDNFHSKHGAETESRHVFIEKGLKHMASKKKSLRILEVGMGTGLNVLLSAEYAMDHPDLDIHYSSLEPLPLEEALVSAIDFPVLARDGMMEVFELIHHAAWNEEVELLSNMTLRKYQLSLQEFQSDEKFDLVYYDAFGPTYQGEMWEIPVFEHLTVLMAPNARLVTYCAQGQFRRNLESLGFEVERLPGPPGKREMVRALYSRSD